MWVLNFTIAVMLSLSLTFCSYDSSDTAGVFDQDIQMQQLDKSRDYELSIAKNQNEYDGILRKYSLLEGELNKVSDLNIRSIGLDDDLQAAGKPELRKDFTKIYHPLSLKSVKKVFHDFGDLYVNETKGQNNDYLYEVLNVERPWSGYWYPFTDRSLYEGDSAPLVKLDRALQNLGFDSDIATEQERRFAGFRPDSWEGFCDGWAFAAILVPEPTASKVIGGVEFSIADLKAISTFAHINYPSTMYGIKYLGNSQTDGAYQDLRPEGFHKVVAHVLGKEKHGLVIDDTPGVQVWNKPLYSYRWQIVQDPERDYAFLVTAYAWLVKERWRPDDIMTTIRDVVAPVYTYRLYVDKEIKNSKGEYKVIAGEWIGASEENHPGNARVAKKDSDIFSDNKEFYKHRNTIKSLFLN